MKTNKEISKMIAQIMAKMIMTPKGQFIGFKEYTNNSGEVANHVVQCNFDYGKAKQNDIELLERIADNNINAVVEKLNSLEYFTEKPTTFAEVKQTAENLLFNMKNPKEKTQKQEDAYINIEGTTIKIHVETKTVHAYSLAVQKTVLVEGEYKTKNSYRETRIQDAIKFHLGFRTLKFRQFKLTADKVSKVTVAGETFDFA